MKTKIASVLTFSTLLLSSSLLWISCGQTEAPKSEVKAEKAATPSSESTSGTPVNKLTDFKFHILIANIPSPIALIDKLPVAGISYKNDLVNPTENESKYSTTFKKALNFGVYSCDLGYLSTNEQFSGIKKYFAASRNLANSLEAGDIFKQIVGTRLDNNMENKDTITHVIDDAYSAMDNYLRTNEKELIATEMITGSWIESQYITMNVLKNIEKSDKNSMLYDKIFEARIHLQNLTKLLSEYESNAEFKPLIEKIKALEAEMTALKIGDIDRAHVEKLAPKVTEIRNMIVN
jgi:hypothetical protein